LSNALSLYDECLSEEEREFMKLMLRDLRLFIDEILPNGAHAIDELAEKGISFFDSVDKVEEPK